MKNVFNPADVNDFIERINNELTKKFHRGGKLKTKNRKSRKSRKGKKYSKKCRKSRKYRK